MLLSKIRNKIIIPTLATSIQHSTKSFRVIRKEKEIKGMQMEREKSDSLYLQVAWYYIEKNLKGTIKKVLELKKLVKLQSIK